MGLPYHVDCSVADCPLTAVQLRAYRALARGQSSYEIADGMGLSRSAAASLLSRGARALGVRGWRVALRALVDAGWIPEATRCGTGTAAERFIWAFEQYLQAPVHERDQLLVRDLCTAALDDLLGISDPKVEG